MLISRIAAGLALTLILPWASAFATEPQGPASSPACSAPAEFVSFGQPLRRMALAIASGDPIVIVAVGSSSTAGAGATSAAKTYPARLEAELQARFPGNPITVVNAGVGGEDARQMLVRFDQGVIKREPDLVLWQVGTNALLQDLAVPGEAPLLRDGIRRLKKEHADVVLIDSQYAPKVLAKPSHPAMMDLLAQTAREERVGLFQRFKIMRHWVESEKIPFEAMLSPDGLHMNDWSYACVAKLIADGIVDAVRPPAIAKARTQR